MSFTKHDFENGDTLTAKDLNEIEDGIVGLNPYSGFIGKKLSIIGDSISSYTGKMPSSAYGCQYPASDVNSVDLTWWGRVINTTGMTLLRNASSAGSCVSSVRSGESTASTTSPLVGASTKRVSDIANGSEKPDIIIVFMGVNDFGGSKVVAELGEWDNDAIPEDGVINTFSDAYAVLLNKLISTYPKAEIFVCTFLEQKFSSWANTLIDTAYPIKQKATGKTIADFNNKICSIANNFGVKVIDLHSCGINYYNLSTYTFDMLHPNAAGFALMARKVLAELVAQSIYSHSV